MFDSAGVLRLRTSEWGGAWVPVFDTKAARSGNRECCGVQLPLLLQLH